MKIGDLVYHPEKGLLTITRKNYRRLGNRMVFFGNDENGTEHELDGTEESPEKYLKEKQKEEEQALKEAKKLAEKEEKEAKREAEKQAKEAEKEKKEHESRQSEVRVVREIINKFETAKGNPGNDGYTPERGKDYWTEEDKKELIDEIWKKVVIPTPKDGITPEAGIDYPSYQEVQTWVEDAVASIPRPKEVDLVKVADAVLKMVVIPAPIPGAPGKDGSPDTPENIKEKLESLKGDDRLDARAIKNLPKTQIGGGHGPNSLKHLEDVSLSSPTNGQALTYQSSTGKWINSSVAGGSGHTIQDEGTPLTARANLNFVGAGVAVTDDAGNDATVVTIGGGGSISDGDKGDITVSGSGATWTIDSGVVSLAKQADVATGTVFYRKTAGTGTPEVQTLATLKTDLGLTGTNSGDQTSIVGITGTKAQFNTAVTDGDILYVGDITQYTDEMAQDAVGNAVGNGLDYDDTTGAISVDETELAVPAANVIMPTDGGSPTLNTLAEDFTTKGSSGVADGTITYVTVGTSATKISVASGEGYIRTTNDQQGELKFCKWAASPDLYTFSAPTAGFENVIFIGIEYSGGTVSAVAKTAFTDWNWYTNFPLARCSYDGTTMRILNAYAHAEDTANLTRKYLRLTMPFTREEAPEGSGGLELSVALRALAMTAGKVWHGFNNYSLGAVASGSAFDTHYKKAGGGFNTTTGVTAYPNTQYDNGSGTLQGLGTNKYGTLWVYLDVSDGSLDVMYGAVNATSVALAQADTIPTTPDHLRYHGRLIGRIIFKNGDPSPALVESAWTSAFGASAVGDHALLTNLQGGTAGEYYHLTSAEYTGTGTNNFVRQTTPTLTTPILGVATATSINKVAITAPATAATLTIADGQTLTVNGSATITNGTHSGTNTGDQTSIVGISGTKAQFDTACSDGNFLYVGDVTQYTDEMAQDAVGAMVDTSLTYVDGTPLLQRAALTGDVTASAGSNATTIANDAVTNAKLANMATQTIKGRTTAGTGDPEDLTATQATAILNEFVGDSGSGGTKGLVKAPAAGDATKFLKGDGTWATPSGSGNVSNTGTPVNNQLAVWTDATTIEGDAALTFDTATNILSVSEVDSQSGNSLTLKSVGDAKDIIATASNASTAVPGGNVTLTAGTGGNGEDGGAVTLVAGVGGDNANGGTAFVYGGQGGATSGAGGDVQIAGGQAQAGNSKGGDVFLYPGAKTGSGAQGKAGIVDPASGLTAFIDASSIASTSKTFTLPNATGTFVLNDNTTTLTNKTLTSPVLTTPSAFTTGGTITLAENTSIALDPAGSADGRYTGITIAGTAGTTLAFGDLIYLAVADSRWELADADAASTSGDVQLGMCVLAAAADGNATTILLYGTIRADTAFPALTVGAPAYVSTTAGDIQVAQPSGTDDVIRRVGFALTADELMFNPSNDYVTHT